jgi:hypothetical protein
MRAAAGSRAESRVTLSILLTPESEVSRMVAPAAARAVSAAGREASGKSRTTNSWLPGSFICESVLIL